MKQVANSGYRNAITCLIACIIVCSGCTENRLERAQSSLRETPAPTKSQHPEIPPTVVLVNANPKGSHIQVFALDESRRRLEQRHAGGSPLEFIAEPGLYELCVTDARGNSLSVLRTIPDEQAVERSMLFPGGVLENHRGFKCIENAIWLPPVSIVRVDKDAEGFVEVDDVWIGPFCSKSRYTAGWAEMDDPSPIEVSWNQAVAWAEAHGYRLPYLAEIKKAGMDQPAQWTLDSPELPSETRAFRLCRLAQVSSRSTTVEKASERTVAR